MESPATRKSLLLRLSDRKDGEAWGIFHAIYRPVLDRLLSQWGLQEADRQEVIQEVFTAVAASIRGYRTQSHAGAFRGWLATITRNKVVDLLRDQKKFPQTLGGSDFLQWLATCPEPNAQFGSELSRWDIEQRRSLFHWAALQVQRNVQPRTWQAFYLTAVRGKDVSQVAEEMEASPGWVYVARSRVLARLKDIIQNLGEIDAEVTEISQEMGDSDHAV